MILNSEDQRLCHLPKKRTGLRVELLASWSMMWRIALTGLLLYVALVTAISLVGYYFSRSGESWVKAVETGRLSIGGTSYISISLAPFPLGMAIIRPLAIALALLRSSKL